MTEPTNPDPTTPDLTGLHEIVPAQGWDIPDAANMKEKSINRRTLVTAAAWSVPVVALAIGAPAQAASTPPANFDIVPVGTPAANVNVARGGQTPFADFTFQNQGPDVAPSVNVAVRVKSNFNNPTATANIIAQTPPAGWSIVTSYQDGGYDVYVFTQTNVAVGPFVLRFVHQIADAAPVGSTYTIDAILQVNDSNPGDNGDWRSTAPIAIV